MFSVHRFVFKPDFHLIIYLFATMIIVVVVVVAVVVFVAIVVVVVVVSNSSGSRSSSSGYNYYHHHRRIGSIRPFLTVETAAELARSLILSRIDYCNFLLAGVTSEQTARLQKIQNQAARLTLRKKRHDYVTPLLKKLHWLPVLERILFRLATLSFRYLMAHYHLTSPAVCPHTHPPHLFVLTLKNC